MLTRGHEHLGPVVRTGPNELSFIGADAWEDIYGVQVGYFIHFVREKGSKIHTDWVDVLERWSKLPERPGLARSCLPQGWADRC